MNRLTGRDGDHAYILKCFEYDGCPNMDTSKCDFCDHHIAVYDSLAAYEDTGMSPEEIIQLNDFSQSQCAKLLEEYGRLQDAVKQAITWLTPHPGDGSRAVERARLHLIAEMEELS